MVNCAEASPQVRGPSIGLLFHSLLLCGSGPPRSQNKLHLITAGRSVEQGSGDSRNVTNLVSGVDSEDFISAQVF